MLVASDEASVTITEALKRNVQFVMVAENFATQMGFFLKMCSGLHHLLLSTPVFLNTFNFLVFLDEHVIVKTSLQSCPLEDDPVARMKSGGATLYKPPAFLAPSAHILWLHEYHLMYSLKFH